MKYTKPEVAVLGEAVRVIERFPCQGETGQPDLSKAGRCRNPAYDLDE